uniref:Reverse transcriptase domain-containing protein n=1 Tax=Sander lucioperca TaxID=283035 RepID=A0A8D0A443_SANLU
MTYYLPSDAACEALNSDITTQEILDAIKSFPNGKSAGPDGFGIELYNKFPEQLTPLLLRIFNHSFETQKFPSSLYEANISLIPKEGRDEPKPSSYRPIALLNSDMKIFTKLMANRLNILLPLSMLTKLVSFLVGFPLLMLED